MFFTKQPKLISVIFLKFQHTDSALKELKRELKECMLKQSGSCCWPSKTKVGETEKQAEFIAGNMVHESPRAQE